jgi:hypothetical protein
MKEYTFYKESVRQETGSHPLSTVTLKEDGSQATLTFLKVFVYKKKKKKNWQICARGTSEFSLIIFF